MGSILLDSGVAIALLDDRDVHHAGAARAVSAALQEGNDLKIAVVSIAELASDSRPGRKARLANLEGFVNLLGPDAVVPMHRETAMRAGEIRASRRSMSLADAMIKAAAESIGAIELITTDRSFARLAGARYVGASRRDT